MQFCPKETFLVVISAHLEVNQEEHLILALCKYKKALGWHMENIKGVDPLICRNHISLEDGAKPVRQIE